MSKPLHVDLGDPRVQQMLGGPSPLASGKREVVQLAGDPANPTPSGLQSTTRLTGGKQEVVVVYGDLLMTIDIYALPGEPIRAQIICPRCHKHSTIRGDQKKIEYESKEANPRAALVKAMAGHSQAELDLVTAAQIGRLSIEAFECAWELGDEKHVAGAVHTGASLCRLRLVIDNNRAREV
jgi:hypothetical protein